MTSILKTHGQTTIQTKSQAMEVVYSWLKQLPNAYLDKLWRDADPYTDAGYLLRWQLSYVLEKRKENKWTTTQSY